MGIEGGLPAVPVSAGKMPLWLACLCGRAAGVPEKEPSQGAQLLWEHYDSGLMLLPGVAIEDECQKPRHVFP